MATTTTIDGILKDDYTELIEQLNNEVFMLSQVEKNSRSTDGRTAKHSIHITRNVGVGARAEGATLPTAGSQGWKQVPVPLRYLYGTLTLTGQVIKLADSSAGAFANAMEKEMQGLKDDWRRDVGRQVWGTSNGVLAATGTGGASTTITLHANTTPTQMRHLNNIGMAIDVGTVAAPTTLATAAVISAIADTTFGSYTVTTGTSVTTVSGTHFVFRTGNGGASSGTGLPGDGQLELTGLQTIVDKDDTLHTLSTSTYPTWRAKEFNNSGTLRPVQEAMITNGLLQAQIQGGSPSLLVTAEGVHLSISTLFTSLKRVMNTVELPGGHKGIEWSVPAVNKAGASSTALVIDYDCPGLSVYGIDPSSLVFYEGCPVEWIDDDGSVLHQTVGKDQFDAALRCYSELACYRRNVNFKVTDLSETTF